MDSWKKLPNDRKIIELNDYSVIIPNDAPGVVPLECPACNLLMRDHDDAISYRSFSCCSECQLDNYSQLNKKTPNPSHLSGQIVPHLDN